MRKRDPDSLDLEQFVLFFFNMISNRLAYTGSKLYSRKFGITLMEWRIVSFLRRREAVSAAEICRTLALDKAAVSRAVGELAGKGFVRVKPIDKRMSSLALTGTGRALHDRVLPFAFERQRILLATLSKAEVKSLLHFLRRLNDQLPEVEAFAERE